MPPRRPTRGAESFFCFCSDTHMVPKTVTSSAATNGREARPSLGSLIKKSDVA